MDIIRCPSCLQENDAEKLAENTEYGCWSGPEVNVYCTHCEFEFEVKCEHAGYIPEEEFNVYDFIRAHKVEIPELVDRNFVASYFRDLVEHGKTSLVKSTRFPEYDPKWEEAYHFAKKEWKRIQNKLADYGDGD